MYQKQLLHWQRRLFVLLNDGYYQRVGVMARKKNIDRLAVSCYQPVRWSSAMSRMIIKEVEIRDADIFEILLDSFPDMIHSIDDQGKIVYTNRTAETLLGYTRDELLSMNVRQIYADEVLQDLERGFSDLKEKGDKNVESLLKAKDGTRIPVEIRSFSIYDDEGHFIRTFSILRDIRAVKELQMSLVHAGRLAAIGELASGVAHDINNPLTVILISNEMCLRELSEFEKSPKKSLGHIKTLAKDVQRASKSIQKLANHLRNFSRGMAESLEIVDLSDSIADSLFMSNNRIQTHNVRIINKLEEGKHFIFACPNNIEQVFVNLIANACDAVSDQKKKEITIFAEKASREGVECWRCDISDTGKGIPEELLADVFQSFFTTKEKGKGTGLGLSISRGIVKEHKGEIEVCSEVGKGTTFSVFLPTAEHAND
jgi:two-component system NtrC family sensor kinase